MKKIFIIILLVAFGITAYYAYSIFKNRDFTENSSSNEKNPITNIKEKTHQTLENIISQPEQKNDEDISQNTEETSEEITDTALTQENAQYYITKNDCDHECTNRHDTDEEYEYCKQICGLVEVKQQIISCDNLTGLKKDYCLRDKAIKDKDVQKCQKIKDSGIKKQCANRISEDIIDEIM